MSILRRGWGLRPRKSRDRRPILMLEPLEPRDVPTGNLTITNALLVDAGNNPITAPVYGEMVFIRAEWRTSGLSSSDQYVVRFYVDGVPLDSASITGQPGTNLNYYWYRGGWYAAPGAHDVQVVVDGANTVAESDETDNTRTFN